MYVPIMKVNFRFGGYTYMEKKMLKVIEELGKVLMDKDNEITFQKYEVDRLKKKITEIEKYCDFYSKE